MLETCPHFKKTNVWDNYQIEHVCGLLWLEALVCNLDKKKQKTKIKDRLPVSWEFMT